MSNLLELYGALQRNRCYDDAFTAQYDHKIPSLLITFEDGTILELSDFGESQWSADVKTPHVHEYLHADTRMGTRVYRYPDGQTLTRNVDLPVLVCTCGAWKPVQL